MKEKGTMAWKEYFIYNVENTNLSAGSGVAFEDTTIRLDSDADFELMKMHHIATDSRIFIRFLDASYGRQLQNTGLDLRAVSGTILFTSGVVDVGIHPNNFIPSIVPRPYPIRAATPFTVSFADFSGAANSVRLSLHGAKLRTGKAPWDRRWQATPPFFYAGGVVLGANEVASFNVQINIDSHFLCRKISAVRTGACLVNITDTATDRAWMNVPTHIDNVAGNSQFPNILPAPRFVYRGSVINVTVTDISGSANTVRMIFHGEKLF